MKSIDRAFIDDLLSRIDIVELIGQKVDLKKHGNSHKGLCPFHAENTPSFNVSSSKQFYHCFGCGASGDAINFLKEHEGLTFMEAIEKLALSVNMKIPTTNNKAYDDQRKLLESNKIVSDIFRANLLKNKKVIDYLESRNITKEQTDFFEIGYANDSWDQIKNYLNQKGFLEEGLETGVLIKTNNKIYDRFRNRVMFPIRNTMGNIIAFGGRTLDKNEGAKYINSPESKLFFKSSQLYGLYESKKDISKLDKIIVVEGYTDVIALHKNNFKNTVATLGTAFTKYHISKLLRYSKNITFCFDGDNAGKAAAWKALNNCLAEISDKVTISFSFIVDDKDPDQLCNDNSDEFKSIIEKSTNLSEFMFSELLKDLDINKVEDKSRFIASIIPLINQIPVGLFKTLMEEKLLEVTNMSRNNLFNNNHSKANPKLESKAHDEKNPYSDSMVLSLFLEYPSLYEKYAEQISPIIRDPDIREMLEIFPTLKSNNKYNVSKFLEMKDEYKNIFLKLSSNRMVDKNQDSASNTLESILINIKRNNSEEEYFNILKKYSNGEKLSDQEKAILKNFKK